MADRRVMKVPQGDGTTALAEETPFETVREDWNVYQLADGTILRIKLGLLRVGRVLGDDGDSIRYNELGEPIYSVQHQISIVAEVPEGLIQKG